VKRIVSLVIGLGILAIIYTRINIAGIADAFRGSNLELLIIGLLLVIPITMITSWRLQCLMPNGMALNFAEANRLVLAASSLNMILPSKAGDFAKAYFMADRGYIKGSLALSLVIFEKTCDFMSLLVWCAFGLFLYPEKDAIFWLLTLCIAGGLFLGLFMLGSKKFSHGFFLMVQRVVPEKTGEKFLQLDAAWNEMHVFFWGDRRNLCKVAITSVFLWFLHLFQIWLFILALGLFTPLIISLALSSIAILIGLLPLTFAGIGTRDAAIIALYHPYFSAASGAALGLLCTTRYLMPAIGGLPFLGRYMATMNIFNRSR